MQFYFKNVHYQSLVVDIADFIYLFSHATRHGVGFCAILSVKLQWAGGESELSQCNIHFPRQVCIRIFSSFSSTQAERAAAGGNLSLDLELMLLGSSQLEDQRHVLSRRQIRHTLDRAWGRIKSEMLWGQSYESDPRCQAESDPYLNRNVLTTSCALEFHSSVMWIYNDWFEFYRHSVSDRVKVQVYVYVCVFVHGPTLD